MAAASPAVAACRAQQAFQVVRFEPLRDWMTGRLVYPDVWWRHDAAGLRDPVLAELEQVRGRSH